MQTKLKLSEIIKTDCYIDCGTNEKLREVYPLIELEESPMQSRILIEDKDRFVKLYYHQGVMYKFTLDFSVSKQTHHISEIDLNA